MNEQLLVDLAKNVNTFALNKTARIIVKGLIAGITPEKIAENLSVTFDISYDVVFKDVQQFIQNLVIANGLLAFCSERL